MSIPHHSFKWLKSHSFLPVDKTSPRRLSETEANDFLLVLQEDAGGYLYNGILSIGAGIQSLRTHNDGRALVKFYYSVFYLARATLGIYGIGLTYEGSKPYCIVAKAGEELEKREGTTHKLVLTQFTENFGSHRLLANQIDGKNPLERLMMQREAVQYKSVVMPDPNRPSQFVNLREEKNIREWLNEYLSDQTGIYEFDKEHACLAYPLQFLVGTLAEFKAKSISCRHPPKNLKFVKSLFCDDKGCLTHLLRHFDNCS